VPVKEDQAYPFISVLSDDESFGEGQQSNVFELLITLSICVKEDNAHTGGPLPIVPLSYSTGYYTK
jgi:hypothetical protein